MTGPSMRCTCCGFGFSSANSEFSTMPEHGVCWTCRQHRGTTEVMKRRRDVDHLATTGQRYRSLRRLLAETRKALAETQHELSQTDVRVVVRIENLDQIIVDEAREARAQAERRRDVAMGALSDVRLLHHRSDERPDRCSCGAFYENCDTAQIVDRWGGVKDWEMFHAYSARHGRRHSLRRDHPGIADSTWFERQDYA